MRETNRLETNRSPLDLKASHATVEYFLRVSAKATWASSCMAYPSQDCAGLARDNGDCLESRTCRLRVRSWSCARWCRLRATILSPRRIGSHHTCRRLGTPCRTCCICCRGARCGPLQLVATPTAAGFLAAVNLAFDAMNDLRVRRADGAVCLTAPSVPEKLSLAARR